MHPQGAGITQGSLQAIFESCLPQTRQAQLLTASAVWGMFYRRSCLWHNLRGEREPQERTRLNFLPAWPTGASEDKLVCRKQIRNTSCTSELRAHYVSFLLSHLILQAMLCNIYYDDDNWKKWNSHRLSHIWGHTARMAESEVQYDSKTHTLSTTQYSSVLLECVFLLSFTIAGICRNPPTSSFWSFTKI